MKYIFAAWATPLILFWGWYFLSLNDINFGYVMLSRQLHDLVFELYGEILGIDPATIPGLVARACGIDTLLLCGIWAFRRRRELRSWWRTRVGGAGGSIAAQGLQPVENALQDEGGGSRIDARLPLLSGDIHLEQRPFGRYRGQPLVPEGKG